MADLSIPLRLSNTLSREKEVFRPIDPENVRMYVCGPTVYDYAHIGNARPAIVFDVLFRVLRHIYGEQHVTYVRNITDVDDKINARAARDFPGLVLNEAIRKVTETTARQYASDVAALGCLPPTAEPRATDFVLPRPDGKADMASLIQALLDRGHAYHAAGEILFDTRSMADYGALSRRPLDEQLAGARVAVDAHKRNAADFVLWKQSSSGEPGWEARFRLEGRDLAIHGRPGWHIECSAMSAAYLGNVFDIHGGGLDLIFPHHENEIAQSRCAHGSPVMANVWMHNGFVQVEGRKMSKSDGNFVTIDELLSTEKFGGRQWPGPVLRLAMLMTHYHEPIDFSLRRLEEAERLLRNWSGDDDDADETVGTPPDGIALDHVLDDLNIYPAIVRVSELLGGSREDRKAGLASLALIGVSLASFRESLRGQVFSDDFGSAQVEEKIADRLLHIREKNWAEADSIRNDLLARGIQLKDGKDPQTGERVTSWEVKR